MQDKPKITGNEVNSLPLFENRKGDEPVGTIFWSKKYKAIVQRMWPNSVLKNIVSNKYNYLRESLGLETVKKLKSNN